MASNAEFQEAWLSPWTWDLRGGGTFSNVNMKLQQGIMGIEKSRRQYQDWPEMGGSLNDEITFQEASNNLTGPNQTGFQRYLSEFVG